MTSPISSALKASAHHLMQASEGAYPANVETAIDLLVDALRRSNKLLVFGNGGSAADAEHICAELVGRFARSRAPMAALALTTNSSLNATRKLIGRIKEKIRNSSRRNILKFTCSFGLTEFRNRSLLLPL